MKIKKGDMYSDETTGSFYVCLEDGDVVPWYPDWRSDIVSNVNQKYPTNTNFVKPLLKMKLKRRVFLF